MTSSTFTTLDALSDGPGFRKVRGELGITAFGVNGLVIPPGFGGLHHRHEHQDELYFVHAGTARFDVDGDVRELGPGGLCHVPAAAARVFTNVGQDDLVLLVVGGKDGYVGRDGVPVMSDD